MGKGTQVGLLKLALEAKGLEVELTREPGGTPIGEKIRHLLKFDPDGKTMTHEAELLLFVSARAQNFSQKILPALNAGKIVICDRFIDSSVVYQGVCRGLGVERVQWLNNFATQKRQPDLTFILDVPVEVGFERVHRRKPEVQMALNTMESIAPARDRMDDFGLEAAQKIREAYLAIALGDSGRCVVVDANRQKEEIAKEILNHVEDRLAKRAAK